MKTLLSFIFIAICLQTFATETIYLQRSPRGLLMGDAYTALAEDEYSLFYNPALLGRHRGLSINLLHFDVGITNALDSEEQDRFDDFPDSDPVLITNRLLDFPLHLRLGTAPGIKMGQFGLTLLAGVNTGMKIVNAIHPVLEVDYRYDRGFAAGYAYNFRRGGSKFKRPRKSVGYGSGVNTSIGFGVKHITREGLDGNYSVFGTTLLNNILNNDNKDFYDIRRSLGFSKGKAWGFDVGFDQTVSMGYTQVGWSYSVMDIGGSKFDNFEGTAKIPEQEMISSFGSFFRQDFGLFGYTFSADLHPIGTDYTFGRMLHLGFMLDLPLVDLFGGINGGWVSYGAQIDIYMFKLTAGFYGVELGREYREEHGKRAVIHLSLLEFSID